MSGRDYSLTGPETARAVAAGLAEADWYRPPIDPARLSELTVRTNARAARDTILWLVLLAGTGTAAWFAWGTWWALPAFLAYGGLYGGAADSRWHEMGHGTAFRTGWLNDAVYYLASFMLLRGPTLWRWSHVRHHTDTIVVGRDPEIIFPRPTSRRMVASTFLGLRVVLPMLVRHLKHAAGRIDDDAEDFVPPDEWRKMVWESRVYVAILVGVGAWSLAAWSILPMLYIGVLPSMYGAWLLVFFGLTQHAALEEDVLDHRRNTRTIYMNPVFRFLYSNMNYHVEHHIFPTVPYHALPRLHEEVKGHLAPALPNTVAAYREIFGGLSRQRRDLDYEIPGRGVPDEPEAETVRVDVGEWTWAGVHQDGRSDLGGAGDLAVGEIREVTVGDQVLAVYRLSEQEYAVTDGICTHGKARLAEGMIVDEACIECPKHNGRFDIRTGEPVRRPVKEPIGTYRVEVIDGHLISEVEPRVPTEATG